mmetsp:Transcript_13345/g.30458  ORF Transcript_13345/g.30458 Transcript_13345/m.30458 type:complete len:473 (-) Transcript_13345:78-1496(-)
MDLTFQEKEEQFCQQFGLEKCTPLPSEALRWDERECEIWLQTSGAFHPREGLESRNSRRAGAAPSDSFRDVVQRFEEGVEFDSMDYRSCLKGRISVVTPTSESRRGFHEFLVESFQAQDWPDKELVVIETYQSKPSELFTQLAKTDRRFVYIGFKRALSDTVAAKKVSDDSLLGSTGKVLKGQKVPRKRESLLPDFTAGVKRNLAVQVATGEWIAHFDDDALYAPNYLTKMTKFMRKQRCSAVKLSAWYVLDLETSHITQADPICSGALNNRLEHDKKVKEQLYGWGFSYVYSRATALDLSFKNKDIGEDFEFMEWWMRRKGKKSIALLKDEFGLCVKTQHHLSLVESTPWTYLDGAEVAKLEVYKTAGFDFQCGIGANFSGIMEFIQKRFPHSDQETRRFLRSIVEGASPQKAYEKIATMLGFSKDELFSDVKQLQDEVRAEQEQQRDEEEAERALKALASIDVDTLPNCD